MGETVSPGVEYQINNTTMPHLLVRLPNGNFHFGPADGSTQQGIKINSVLGRKDVWRSNTAPDPSFIGYLINDIFIYKNRLAFFGEMKTSS